MIGPDSAWAPNPTPMRRTCRIAWILLSFCFYSLCTPPRTTDPDLSVANGGVYEWSHLRSLDHIRPVRG